VDEVLSRCGHTPLPPYIKRPDEDRDKVDYQTVYAKNAGATASPTAGLHFTSDLLKAIEEKGVRVCYVTLHTSYGTFAPVKHEKIEDHRMHAEYFNMPDESAKVISDTKKDRGKIFAVGTTATRVLEHYFNKKEKAGYTDLFIYPSYKFKVVDCLVTNFHLPKSTLLMLVSAFSKREFILKAYKEAIDKGYRFFSYGDAMLII